MRTPSRRQLLRLSGTAVAGSLAGCVDGLVGADDSEADPLLLDKLLVDNETDEFQTVHVYLSRRESEEIVFWDSTTVPPFEYGTFQDYPRTLPADTVLTARLGNGSFAGPADEVVAPMPLREDPRTCHEAILYVGDGSLALDLDPPQEPCEQSESELSVSSLTPHSKLTVQNRPDSYFGGSVSLSGDGTTALVSESGETRIFTHGNGWTQQARLDVDSEYSPIALSADGTTAIIESGSGASLFRQGENGWAHSTELIPERATVRSVSLTADGRTAALGSTDSVPVFTFDGTWERQTTLTDFEGGISNIELSDDGSTLIFTVEREERHNGVQFFAADGGGWLQQGTVEPAGRDIAVDRDGSTALLGARRDEKAAVFTRDDGEWTEHSRLTVSDADPSAYGFGNAVALSADGSRALVGAEGTSRNDLPRVGAAYLFDRDGDTWTLRERLVADDGDDDDYFGTDVALSAEGHVSLVGAEEAESHNTSNAGAAYVFRY